jgi:hypothetical protein
VVVVEVAAGRLVAGPLVALSDPRCRSCRGFCSEDSLSDLACLPPIFVAAALRIDSELPTTCSAAFPIKKWRGRHDTRGRQPMSECDRESFEGLAPIDRLLGRVQRVCGVDRAIGRVVTAGEPTSPGNACGIDLDGTCR